ncbi:MAG: type II toxin-antitoxin system HicA family toxin [Pseudomonadota bacterium]
MGATYYQALTALLKNNGCVFVRQGKGDHEIWYSPHTKRNIIVDKGGKVRHTANNTLKTAGLPKAF